MKILRVVLALLLAATPLFASEESHKAAVEKLFEVMKLKDQYEASLLAGFNSGAAMNDKRISSLPIEQQNKINAGLEKVRSRMLELMGWDVVKADIATVYMKNFTEEEVVSITKMMDSPTGQMLVSKQVKLLPESMAIGQRKAQEMMPEIMRIMQENMQP